MHYGHYLVLNSTTGTRF